EEKAPPEKAGEKYQLKRMIDVYKKFKNDEFHVPKVYEPSTNRITHYRTRAMDYSPSSVPSWGAASDSLRTIVVNRVNIGATNKKKAQVDHYFFEDIAWRFKYHPYRPKKTGEGKCY